MAVRETINRIPCLPNLLLSPIFIAQGTKDNFRWRWDDTPTTMCVGCEPNRNSELFFIDIRLS